VLTHARRPSDVLEWTRNKVERSLQKGLQEAADRVAAYARLTGVTVVTPDWQPLVLTYSELYARVGRRSGEAGQDQVRRLTEQPGLDGPERSRFLVEYLWQRSGLSGPAAVVGFASLAYPATSLDLVSAGPFADRFREILELEARAAGEWSGSSVRLRGYFPGVSDMSFLARGFTEPDLATLAENTPAWDLGLAQPRAGHFALPVVNIGPWGRDPHLRLERVHAHYAFETVPELVWRVALAALRG
nr:peptidase M20 [Candidatus Dormibacteraeota bacterium]